MQKLLRLRRAPELSFSVIVGSYQPPHGSSVTEVWACLLLDQGGNITTAQSFLAPNKLTITDAGGRNISTPPRLGTPSEFRWVWSSGDNGRHNNTLTVDGDASVIDFSFSLGGATGSGQQISGSGGDGLRLQGSLSQRVPWDRAHPDSSGPEGWLEPVDGVLPTHYYVQTLASKAHYKITPIFVSSGLPAGPSLIGGGFAHQEANWGGKFPVSWVWAEAISRDGQTQLVLTAGEFEIAGVTTKQSIIAFRTPGHDVTFRNIDLEPIVFTHKPCGSAPSIILEAINLNATRRLVIEMEAPLRTFSQPLEAPVSTRQPL